MVERLSKQRTPREYGNLVNSAYTRRAQDEEMSVEVGYTAAYAIWVHENMEQKLKGKPRASGLGVYWGPAGQPKFLESALVDLESSILKTVRKNAEIK